MRIVDVPVMVEDMPGCCVCGEHVEGGEPTVIGKVKSGSYVAFALAHERCVSDEE